MERNRKERLPWAIALLIVTFTIVIALAGGRIISNATHRSSYDYKAVQLASNRKLQVVDDGFVYYDGSYIGAVTTDGRVKWSHLLGRNADFDATIDGIKSDLFDGLVYMDLADDTGETLISNLSETLVATRKLQIL